jgi:hypothetical protein
MYLMMLLSLLVPASAWAGPVQQKPEPALAVPPQLSPSAASPEVIQAPAADVTLATQPDAPVELTGGYRRAVGVVIVTRRAPSRVR